MPRVTRAAAAAGLIHADSPEIKDAISVPLPPTPMAAGEREVLSNISPNSQEGAHVGEDVTSKDSVGDAKGKKAKTGAGKKGNGPKRQSSSDELLMGEHQSVSFEMSVRNKTDEVTQEVLGDKRPSPSASALETEVEDATREHEDDIAQFPVNDDGLMALPSNPACTPGANVVEAREQISSSKWQAARNEDVEQTPGIQPPVDEMASSLREEPAHKMPEASKTAEKEQSPFLYEQQKVDQAELHPEAVDKETTAEDPIISAQKTARHQYDHSAERNLCQVERTSVQNGSPDATAPLDHASSRTSADMADALQKSPKPVKRLEDSIEAIDALEEAIEEIGKALPGVDMPAASTTPCKSVAIHASSKTDGSGVSGLRKMPASDIKTNGRPSTISRTTSTRKPVAPKKDINAAATVGHSRMSSTRSTLGRASSVRKPPPKDAPSMTESSPPTKTASKNITLGQRPISLSFPKPPPPPKSTKPPTKPTFQLPGEAVAAKLKAAREARMKKEGEEEDLKARRGFKARPIRQSLAPVVVKGTASSRARESLMLGTSVNGNERNRAGSGAKGTTIQPLNRASSVSKTNERRPSMPAGKGMSSIPRNTTPSTTENGEVKPRLSSLSVSKRASVAASVAVPVATAPNASKPRMASATVGQRTASQTKKGEEVFNRAALEKEEADKKQKEKEEAARKARAEAAERGRIASREWAKKKRAKEMQNKARESAAHVAVLAATEAVAGTA
ncbi:hypothetical protein BJ546DRAFT_295927 [Cryomyces antarcticus]